MYNKLCTQLYIAENNPAFGSELDFYMKLLQPKKGPWLEAMCGSGRLLIPLLKNGIHIDGVDSSSYMLEACKKACLQEQLVPELFEQSITTLSLPKKYAGIIIAFASFQLINRADAAKTLQLLREQLLPGGFLVLETFIPWDSIKECINNDQLVEKMQIDLPWRSVTCPDAAILKASTKVTIYPKEQRKIAHARYEKYTVDGALVEMETEEFTLHWYYQYEMQLLLETAGFIDITLVEASFALNPHAIIFKAIRK